MGCCRSVSLLFSLILTILNINRVTVVRWRTANESADAGHRLGPCFLTGPDEGEGSKAASSGQVAYRMGQITIRRQHPHGTSNYALELPQFATDQALRARLVHPLTHTNTQSIRRELKGAAMLDARWRNRHGGGLQKLRTKTKSQLSELHAFARVAAKRPYAISLCC